MRQSIQRMRFHQPFWRWRPWVISVTSIGQGISFIHFSDKKIDPLTFEVHRDHPGSPSSKHLMKSHTLIIDWCIDLRNSSSGSRVIGWLPINGSLFSIAAIGKVTPWHLKFTEITQGRHFRNVWWNRIRWIDWCIDCRDRSSRSWVIGRLPIPGIPAIQTQWRKVDMFKCEEARVKVIVYRQIFVCCVFTLIGTRKSTAFSLLQNSKNKCHPST